MINKIKTWSTRQEFMIALLRLSKYEGDPSEKGVVLVQIDGLALRHFKIAVEEGYFPFVQRQLMKRRGYDLARMYPGLPSNTPSFQGELFYGVRQCVPAFRFVNQIAKEEFTLYLKQHAAAVESELAKKGNGLLEGGSCYGNIFAGGASEPHITASSASWKSLWSAFNPYTWLLLILFNAFSLLKIFVLVLIECLLACWDAIRGILKGYSFLFEIQFILTRVLVSIVMRESITAMAQVDIRRGLPIIHLNYFGYDEQAHRRGPSTRFAKWSLRGIDSSIADLWKMIQKSRRRSYELWIYSDHGQEDTQPYEVKHKVSLTKIMRNFFPDNESNANAGADEYDMTTLGPVAHIYFKKVLQHEEEQKLCEALVKNYHVPLIVIPNRKQELITYWTEAGCFPLIESGDSLPGPSHPYKKEVIEDLISLCGHPDCGDLVLFGWRDGCEPLTFTIEQGAHAGFGPVETDAFVLFPSRATSEMRAHPFLRPIDLRDALIKHFLPLSKTPT